jgi:hypothetical protein
MDSAQAVMSAFSPPAPSFYTVTPCRAADSRERAFGGPAPLVAGTEWVVPVGDYASGQTRASHAVVALSAQGALTVYANQPRGTGHVVIDVNGHFRWRLPGHGHVPDHS